jgi:hypothetical protein
VWLLERSASDVTPRNGCQRCLDGRDRFTGWGRLDVQAALKLARTRSRLPVADALEPNDDAGPLARAFGPPRTITASLDYWDDPLDVYAIKLRKGQSIFAHMDASSPAVKLVLWKPTTVRLDAKPPKGSRAAQSVRVGKQERIEYAAPSAGTYFLQVKLTTVAWTRPSYRLTVTTAKAAPAR